MEGMSAAAIVGIIGTAVAVAGTTVTVVSSIQQANAQADAAESEQKARNAEAESARQAAAYEETQFRRRAALLIGKNQAIAAASGMDTMTGSPIVQELDAIQQTELEALNIRRTGAVTASSREFEGRLAAMKGGFARSQIGGIAVGGALKAGSTILGSWSSYNKASTLSGRLPAYYTWE